MSTLQVMVLLVTPLVVSGIIKQSIRELANLPQ